MPRNGSGSYSRSDGVRTGSNVFQQQESAGLDIESVWLDAEAQDMADEITNSLAKDGQTNPTANLPMNGFKHTGVADTASRTDYVKASQLMDGALLVLNATGTNTMTASATPAVTAYVNRMTYWVTIASTNTSTTPSLNIDSQGAKTIVKPGDVALRNGDLQGGATYPMTYNSSLGKFVVGGTVYVDNATLTTDTTTGQVKVNGGGIDTTQMANGAISPAKTDFLEDGNVTNQYFAKTNGSTSLTEGPSGWTITQPGTGTYNVTHSFGDTGYGVIAQSHAAETYVTTTAIQSNSFQFTVTDAAGAQQNSVVDLIVWRY